MNKVVLVLAMSLIIFTSCKEGKTEESINLETEHTEIPQIGNVDEVDDIKVLYVASKLDDCAGMAPKKCMMVKEEEDAPWEIIYQEIEGFKYEEGYEYKIEVKRIEIPNAPADAPLFRYVLVSEISKVKKN